MEVEADLIIQIFTSSNLLRQAQIILVSSIQFHLRVDQLLLWILEIFLFQDLLLKMNIINKISKETILILELDQLRIIVSSPDMQFKIIKFKEELSLEILKNSKDRIFQEEFLLLKFHKFHLLHQT